MLTTPPLASVKSIPRISPFTGHEDPSTAAELKALAAEIVKAENENYLHQEKIKSCPKDFEGLD
jgi:hypothetical protein